jgi:CheY-like chemotaxis protein
MNTHLLHAKYLLLADDDADDCMIFQEALLEVSKHSRLETAKDGFHLMQILEATVPLKPDLIFLDLNMPRKNGFECLGEIRHTEKFKDIPIVIFSTSDGSEAVKMTYEMGASIYVQKPYSFKSLTRAILKVLSLDMKAGSKQPEFDNYFYAF